MPERRGAATFSGLLHRDGTLSMVSMRVLGDAENRRMVRLRVPMTPELVGDGGARPRRNPIESDGALHRRSAARRDLLDGRPALPDS